MKVKEIRSMGSIPSSIMIVGECPHAEEIATGLPFTGYSYTEFGKMLSEAGISINNCYRTHVLKTMPSGGDASVLIAMKKTERTIKHISYRGREVLKPLIEAIDHLEKEIELVRPNVIIAMGNVALFALTSLWSVHSWRSSLLECDLPLKELDYKPKVIPTYSMHTVHKMFEWRWIVVHDIKRAVKESETRELVRRKRNFTVRPTYIQTIAVLDQLYKMLQETYMETDGTVKLAADIETKHYHIECISIAWSNTEAICIPFHLYIPSIKHYWTLEEEIEIIRYLKLIFEHPALDLVGQNWAYDDTYIFRRWFIDAKPARDTMITQHSIFSNTRKSLDFISSLYLEDHLYWKDDRENTFNEERWNYNCTDACITYEADTAQQSVIHAMGKEQIALFQNNLYHAVMRSMRKGIRYNKELANEYAVQLEEMTKEREDYIQEVLGFLPNIDSPKQMSDLFYRLLAQPKQYDRKTMSVSCADAALEAIAENEPLLEPITSRISEIRSISKCQDFLETKLTPEGRMTTYYNIAGTDTYRFSSHPNAFGEGNNLQNLTDGTRAKVELPNMKYLLIPDPGHVYFDADFDSADLRIVAASADEQEIFAMLNEGKKVYVEAMKEYFHNPDMTKHDPFYVKFKAICHGTNYLGRAKGLASNTGLLVHEVDKVQKWYYEKFPKIKAWQNDVKDQAEKRKMVENILGYKLYIFKRIEGTVMNEIIAWIPQSTIASLVDLAYYDLHIKFPDKCAITQLDVLQQTHDSIAGQFPLNEQDFYVKEIKQAMERELPFDKPIVIPSDVHLSELSWGHCK